MASVKEADTMNAPILAYSFALGEPSGFAELASVRIARDVVTDDGVTVSAGSRGTVVSTYVGGTAYEVEFEGGTATVEADLLTAA